MAATSGTAMVASPINLTGALLNKTRTDTPLFNMIPGRYEASRVFITGAYYDLGYPSSTVAGISETASLTAPDPQYWARQNASNVTQIFQRSVAVSYRKMSNAADLNNYIEDGTPQPALVGNTNNVPNELAFQIANMLDAIRLDIEYCIINGVFQDSEGDPSVADQTRGIIAAVTTNVVAAGNVELNYGLIYDAAQKILMSGSPFALDSYLFVLNFEQFKQLQKVVANEGLKIDQSEAGVNVTRVVTPFGVLRFMPHRFMPNGTAVLMCLPVMANVFQPTPGKGNFFYEPLAKTGAAEKGQVYGQWGLDYGQEWLHLKITGLKQTTEDFTAPQRYVVNLDSANFNIAVSNPTSADIWDGDDADDFQSDVTVGDGVITGTSLYRESVSSFDMSKGHNFLALHIEADAGTTIKVGVQPTQGGGMVETDETGDVLFQITNETAFVDVEATKDGKHDSKRFKLELTLNEE